MLPTVQINEASVDVRGNTLRLSVNASDLALVRSQEDELRGLVRELDVEFGISEPVIESVCPHRAHCWSPMRSGLSDEQFLTAGHCGYSGSNQWDHFDFGYVGTELGAMELGYREN